MAIALKKKIAGVTVTLDLSVPAFKVNAKDKAFEDADYVAGMNEFREYFAMEAFADKVDADIDAHAFAMMKDCTTFEDYSWARKGQFTPAFSAQYAVKFPNNDEKAMLNARDQAWNRFIKRCAKLGYTVPTKSGKPKATPAKKGVTLKGGIDQRTANAQKRAADKLAKENTAANKSAELAKVPAIAVHMAKDVELKAAIEWITASGANAQAFKAWFKTQKSAQLSKAA
jgi:hypothetical protein